MPLFSGAQIEAGAFGKIASLAGLPGKLGLGRQVVCTTGTVTATVALPIVGTNLQRIAALIQNTGANTMVISFGGTATTGIQVVAGASFQIDSYFPWTGTIVLYNAAGDTTYNLIEVSNRD